MNCPYLANPLRRCEPVRAASRDNVCFAYAAQHPNWNYTTVDTAIQEDTCMRGKTHLQCKRYELAQAKAVVPPLPVAQATTERRWWFF